METLCSLAASYSAGYGNLYRYERFTSGWETIDNIHSVYVDQWIGRRWLPRKNARRSGYSFVSRELWPWNVPNFYWVNNSRYYNPFYPTDSFYTCEELRKQYPGLSPKEREERIACQFRGGFIRGSEELWGMERLRRPFTGLWRLVHWGGRRFGRFETEISLYGTLYYSLLSRFLRWGSGWIGLPWKNNCGWKCRDRKNCISLFCWKGNYPKQWGGIG